MSENFNKTSKLNIMNYDPDKISQGPFLLRDKRFRAKQMLAGCQGGDEMTNIPSSFRTALVRDITLDFPEAI